MINKVACSIRLMDDLDGTILKGSLAQFEIGGYQVKPLYKAEGYSLIMNRSETQLDLKVEVHGYKPFEGKIDLKELNPREPIYTIRLLPALNYPKKVKNWIEGKVEGAKIPLVLVPIPEKKYLKLGAAKVNGEKQELNINMLTPVALTRLNLGIVEKDAIELFWIEDKRDTNVFTLNKFLSKKYKLQTEVIRVYQGVSDLDGSYKIPIDDFYKTNHYKVIYKMINV